MPFCRRAPEEHVCPRRQREQCDRLCRELQRGACLHVLNDHSSSVAAIGWHLASGCLATGAEDGTIHLWDASGVDGPRGGADMAPEPPRVVQSLCIEHCEILCITPSADGTALFCGLEEGSMALLSSHSD